MDHSNHTLLQAGSQTAISDRMRELLARAAQDHVYEQRTQGAVLDEIRQRLEGMEWLLREVRERELGGLSGTLEAVNGRLDHMAAKPPEWAEGLAQHVEVVRERVDVVRDHVNLVGDRVKPIVELPSLWADLGTVGESVEEALKRLQAVLDGTQGISAHIGEFTKRLGHLQASMEAAGGRFTRLDKTLAELTQHTEGLADAIDRVGDRLGGLDERLDSVDGRIDSVDGRLDAVAGRLDSVDGRIITVAGRLDSVDGRIDTVAGQIEITDQHLLDIDGKISGVDTRLGGHDDRFDGLEGRFDSRFTTLDERMITTDTRFEQVNERLDIVDDRVEAVNQRIGQLPATLNVGDLLQAVQARPDREEIADAVTRRLGALEETMLALAEALLRPTRGGKE